MSTLNLSQKMALERCQFTLTQLVALFFLSSSEGRVVDEHAMLRLFKSLEAEFEHLDQTIAKSEAG